MHAEKVYAAGVRIVWFIADEQGDYSHSWTYSFMDYEVICYQFNGGQFFG